MADGSWLYSFDGGSSTAVEFATEPLTGSWSWNGDWALPVTPNISVIVHGDGSSLATEPQANVVDSLTSIINQLLGPIIPTTTASDELGLTDVPADRPMPAPSDGLLGGELFSGLPALWAKAYAT